MTPKNIHTYTIPQRKFIFQGKKYILQFKILNPPKIVSVYVYMKISEYPPPPPPSPRVLSKLERTLSTKPGPNAHKLFSYRMVESNNTIKIMQRDYCISQNKYKLSKKLAIFQHLIIESCCLLSERTVAI